MIAALPLMALGSLLFVEQNLPGIQVSPPSPLSGTVETNFRHADIDRDGLLDLVFPDAVCFQRDGQFPRDARQPLPNLQEPACADLWGDSLYVRYADRIEIVRWVDGQWQRPLIQPIKWPQSPLADKGTWPGNRPVSGLRFTRFLYDLDADGSPEWVLPAEDGLHIYRRSDQGYIETARLDVFPPLTVARMTRQSLWPPETRRILFPPREMVCRFILEGTHITSITREDLPAMRVRYHVKRCSIDPKNAFAVLPDSVQEDTTDPMPSYMHPCRLNNDDLLDYAGGDWELAETSVLPVPVFETAASFDAGKTIQTIRTESFRPQCSFVDFDGDGRHDMVTESTGLFDGGIRESVSRFLTSRTVEHEVHVHLQLPERVFSKHPDIRARFSVHLDAPPYRNSDFFQRYQSGEIIDVTGDFNADARKDIAIQDAPDRLAIYLNTAGALQSRPDATITLCEGCRFAVVDVDGDGRSDIVIRDYDPASSDATDRSRVYFAREATP